MKPRRKKRGGVKSFYIAAAMVLLATGGIARITVDKAEKITEPSRITYTESDYQQPTIPSENSDTTESEQPNPNETEPVQDAESTVDTAEDTEETKEAATAKVLTYAMPIKANIIKPFSKDSLIYSETYGDMRTHDGIDIVAEEGTTVKPCADGTVSEVKEDSLWGNTVVIEHQDGNFSYYCGLNDVTVKEGEEVTMSKIVGTVGEVPCECLDTSHLHFAIKDKDGWLSPLEVMGLQQRLPPLRLGARKKVAEGFYALCHFCYLLKCCVILVV